MGRMNADMMMVAICQEFKWGYDTYLDQPQFFLELIREKLVRDNKEAQMKRKI